MPTRKTGQELAACRRILAERLDLDAQAPEQDVEVADRAERAPEPPELLSKRLRPLGVEQVVSRAEEGAESPRCHAHLVQLLYVGAEPRAGVVRKDERCLLTQAGAERRGGGSIFLRLGHIGAEVQVERLEDLRTALAVGGAGSAQRFLDAAERLLVSVEQLHLELVEAARDALVVEHSDVVVNDFGTVGTNALAPGAQAGDRRQRRASQVAPARRASRLGRGASGPPGSPARAAPARAAASVARALFRSRRDGEASRRGGRGDGRGVVIGRDEEPRLDRLAAELRQREIRRRREA